MDIYFQENGWFWQLFIINNICLFFKFQGVYPVELLLRFFLCMILTNSKLWNISGTLASLGNNLLVITFLLSENTS